MADRSNEDYIEAIEDVLTITLALVRDLTDEQADLPTDCPGWTVRDQLAHMVGLEQTLSGSPQPDIELPPLDHVTSDVDRYMELAVHARRALPLAAIADELRGLVPRRLDQLRQQAAQGDPEVASPFGRRRLSVSLPIRVFDLWAHEQDIRRALGMPPRVRCDAAKIALERTLAGWTGTLPERIEGVDGQLVVTVVGEGAKWIPITLGAGGESASLAGDAGDLTWLGCGRGFPDEGLLHGDPDVVAAVKGRLALTP